jgi:hypothetical protein
LPRRGAHVSGDATTKPLTCQECGKEIRGGPALLLAFSDRYHAEQWSLFCPYCNAPIPVSLPETKPLPPYVAHSDTSKAAAESMREGAAYQRQTVLAHITECGMDGATSDEVEAKLTMRHQSASARFVDLARLDLIVDSKQRRKTRSGRTAAVWVARSIWEANT